MACLPLLPPEVLSRIVSFVPSPEAFYESDDYDDDRAPRNTLISLMVTCRSLSEAAIDRLWAKLPSLVPLIYTLPRDLWTVPDVEGVMRVDRTNWTVQAFVSSDHNTMFEVVTL